VIPSATSEVPSFQRLTAILILHNFADEMSGSEPEARAFYQERSFSGLGAMKQPCPDPMEAVPICVYRPDKRCQPIPARCG
jgi:hypothetical protein